MPPQGRTVRDIICELGPARTTVRRFAHADSVEESLVDNGTGKRSTIIEPYETYLREHFAAGCTNATVLWQELSILGYSGGRTSLTRPHPPLAPHGRTATSPAEAGWLVKVDPKTVAAWAKRGAIRSLTTPGGHRRYYRSDLENLLHHLPPGPRST